jgi:hypothetical protein
MTTNQSAKIDPTTVAKIAWESDTCSRCFGTGRMPYSAYGGVCFKCNGNRVCITAAGRAARKAFMAARREACTLAEAQDLVVGDKISTDGERFHTVTEIRSESSSLRKARDDEDGSRYGGYVRDENKIDVVVNDRGTMVCPMAKDHPVLVWSPGAFLAGVAKVVNRKGVVLTFK